MGRGEGIFQAENIRTLLLGLICTADPAQPPGKGGREMFEGFDFIEGYPNVRPPHAPGGGGPGGGVVSCEKSCLTIR